jgi:uncharacterized membrane protein
MKRLKQFLINTLIGGFLVLLPLTIFVIILKLIIQFIVNIIRPITLLVNLEIPVFLVNLLVFTSLIVFCFLIGLSIRTQIGRTSLKYFEVKWLEKLPAYGTIRDIVQQFTGAKKTAFHRVVLIDAFGTGAYMTGFITDEDEEAYSIFTPTAPNPTNGFVFHIPKSQVIHVDARAEEAMRSIVGLGVGSLIMINRTTRKFPDQKNMSSDRQTPVIP